MKQKCKTGKTVLFVQFLFMISSFSFAQRSLKFENGGGPSGSGPSATNKVVTIYNGDANEYSPTTTITFSISDQQYPSIEGNSSIPGLVFGGNVNGNGNSPLAANYYQTLNNVGNSQSAQFSTGGATPAMNAANDYGVSIIPFSDALINSNGSNKVATNSKNVYFGKLTLTFNRPVNNPIIHFSGMGGFYSPSGSSTLGLSAGFKLNETYSISRLSGNPYFQVSADKKMYNSAANYTSNVNNSSPSGASGSIRINGNDITTLTFDVVLDGDGGAANWSATNRVNGDVVLVSVSLTAYSVSGTVFNDANGLSDNLVNGTGSNAGGLNVVLIDANGNVAAVAPVSSDGTYSFDNAVVTGTYSMELTTESAAVGSPAPAVVLPEGWVATGEKLGSGTGDDGSPDGMLKNVVVNNGVADANFGIEQLPVTENVSQMIKTPEGNTVPKGTLTTAPKGTDPEDGALGQGNSVAITELPSNGTLYYNDQPVTKGQVIPDFDPSNLSITDLEGGSDATSFGYSFVDAAGKQSKTAGTYTVKFDTPLSVTFSVVTAQLDGTRLIVKWGTVAEENNDHFDVEISNDGTHFTKIGTVKSKAKNGNSSSRLMYEFESENNKILVFAGIYLLGIGILFLAFCKKNKLLVAAMLVGTSILAITPSCTKKRDTSIEQGKVFVRIVQVDVDGSKQVSKVVQALEK